MYIQIAICLPLAFLLLISFYFTGLLCNKFTGIYKPGRKQPYMNFVGHCALGFVLLAALYAVIVTRGKTTLTGLLMLILIYNIFYRHAYNEINLKQEILALPEYKIFYTLAALLAGSYFFILFQNYAAFNTGYPMFYYDYHFYALISKGLGATGIENALSPFRSYGLQCGTLLYHYTDLWLVDLIARITHLNQLPVIIFVIYPVMLSLLIAAMIGVIKFMFGDIKHLQVLLLIIAGIGLNIYLTGYSHIALLDNFGLKCFPGLYQAHKIIPYICNHFLFSIPVSQ